MSKKDWKHVAIEDLKAKAQEMIDKGEDVPAEWLLSMGGIYAGQILFETMQTIKADNFIYLAMYLPEDETKTEYELIFRKKKNGFIRWLIRKLNLI